MFYLYYITPNKIIGENNNSTKNGLLFTGSTTLFNALLTKCLEKGAMAICRYIPRQNNPPRFIALVPQEEQLDEQNVQIVPAGNLNVIF